jgi:hypothetical protein
MRGGVFRSSDNGGSWTASNNGLTHSQVASLAVRGPDLFAATWVNKGIRRTLVRTMAAMGAHLFAATDGLGGRQNRIRPFPARAGEGRGA